MNQRQREALDRAAEFAQERSRSNWNRIVGQMEQDVRDERQADQEAETEAQQRRSQFQVVHDNPDV